MIHNKMATIIIQNVTSMVDKLNYDPMFLPAMMHVFGKTLIAKDIDHASQFSKSENLDCVTLEGTRGGATCYHGNVVYYYQVIKLVDVVL